MFVTSDAKEITGLSTYEKEDGDEEGSFVLGAVAEEETDSGNVRVMVISTGYLFDTSINSFTSGNNETLFLNGLK